MSLTQQKKIKSFTLEIADQDLNQEYKVRRFRQVNYVSRIIVYAKLTYGLFIIWQYFKGRVGWKRPFSFQLFVLVHLAMVNICERFPTF